MSRKKVVLCIAVLAGALVPVGAADVVGIAAQPGPIDEFTSVTDKRFISVAEIKARKPPTPSRPGVRIQLGKLVVEGSLENAERDEHGPTRSIVSRKRALSSHCMTATHGHGGSMWAGSWAVKARHRWCWDAWHKISYRETQPWTEVSGICGTAQPAQSWKVAGGVYYSYVRVRVQAEFTCNGFGWNIYETTWMVNHMEAYNSWMYDHH